MPEGRKLALTQITFDNGPGVVVVDGLVIHGFDSEPFDLRVLSCLHGNVADKVFNKNGIVIGTLGHGFFIRSFEDAIKLAASAGFDEFDEILDPNRLAEADGKSDQTSLIVGTALADGFGTRAKSGDWHLDSNNKVDGVGFCIDFENDAVV